MCAHCTLLLCQHCFNSTVRLLVCSHRLILQYVEYVGKSCVVKRSWDILRASVCLLLDATACAYMLAVLALYSLLCQLYAELFIVALCFAAGCSQAERRVCQHQGASHMGLCWVRLIISVSSTDTKHTALTVAKKTTHEYICTYCVCMLYIALVAEHLKVGCATSCAVVLYA
jgi:hypothetical protein